MRDVNEAIPSHFSFKLVCGHSESLRFWCALSKSTRPPWSQMLPLQMHLHFEYVTTPFRQVSSESSREGYEFFLVTHRVLLRPPQPAKHHTSHPSTVNSSMWSKFLWPSLWNEDALLTSRIWGGTTQRMTRSNLVCGCFFKYWGQEKVWIFGSCKWNNGCSSPLF